MTRQYRLRDKKARNDAVRRYRQEHPDITQEELAEMFNISRQRVGQLLNAPRSKKTESAA